MVNCFKSIISRFNKIADIYVDEYDNGKLIIRKDDAIQIVEDEQRDHNEHLWNPLWEKRYPENLYGELSRPILVRYKDVTADPEVCRYNFSTKKFVLADEDITNLIKEWSEIPGYGYDD